MLNSAAVSPSDAATVRRSALLEAARPRLLVLARRLVWDTEDANDVVQSALLLALDRWHTLADESRVEPWLRRIVVNRAWSHLRRRRFWNAVGSVLLVAEETVAPSPDLDAERSQHQARLAAELSKLSAKQSLAFSLRYLEGWSFDEIAESMNIDRGTVRVHVQRAVAALRDRGVLEGDE